MDCTMRHAAVTGATGGIGGAIARELASSGYDLTLVGRRRIDLEELSFELNTAVHVAVADLSDPSHATQWIPASERRLGPIDILINNAGTLVSGRFSELSDGEARAIVEVDLVAPLALIRALLPGMIARGRGAIVNVASTGALAPNPGMVAYCAAKAGLAAASESLRGELRGTGVNVITVYPGPIPTAMLETAHAGYPASRIVAGLPAGRADELARRIRRAIDRRRSRVIYPRVYTIFRYLPWIARRLLDRFTPAPLPRTSR